MSSFTPELSPVASTKTRFDLEYQMPQFAACSMDKYIVGVSENMKRGYGQFQMIFNDGTRTSGKADYDESEWFDKQIPSYGQFNMTRVEVLYAVNDNRMMGIKFWDKNDSVLLATEDFD